MKNLRLTPYALDFTLYTLSCKICQTFLNFFFDYLFYSWATTNFSWIAPPGAVSSTLVTPCNQPLNTVTITVSTFSVNPDGTFNAPLNHSLSINGTFMYVPTNNSFTNTRIGFRIAFSSPVNNMSLSVSDLDDVNPWPTIWSEFLSNFTDANGNQNLPTSITQVPGSTVYGFLNNGIYPPSNEENCGGILNWTTAQTEINFIYNRPNNANAGLLIDFVPFDCQPSCNCNNQTADIINPTLGYLNTGFKNVSLNLNSSEQAISKLVATVSNYEILTDADCLNINPTLINGYGKIVTSGKINGISPTFGRSSILNSASNELIYIFP